MSTGARGELILHIQYLSKILVYIQESQNLKKFQK